MDVQKSTSQAATMNLEQVTVARQKRDEKKALARRFLRDPRFQQAHLDRLKRQAKKEIFSSSPRVGRDRGRPVGLQVEEVAIREVFNAQRELREAQEKKAALAEAERSRIQPTLETAVGGLAGTIRLRQLGMLRPPAERNGSAAKVIAEGDAEYMKLKKGATSVLQQRVETARLAEEQERQRRIVTFPERKAG